MNWKESILVLLRRAVTTQEPSVITLGMRTQHTQVWIVSSHPDPNILSENFQFQKFGNEKSALANRCPFRKHGLTRQRRWIYSGGFSHQHYVVLSSLSHRDHFFGDTDGAWSWTHVVAGSQWAVDHRLHSYCELSPKSKTQSQVLRSQLFFSRLINCNWFH